MSNAQVRENFLRTHLLMKSGLVGGRHCRINCVMFLRRCESINKTFLELDLESDGDHVAVVAFLDKLADDDCADMSTQHTPLPDQA